jgi:hypothetical protein
MKSVLFAAVLFVSCAHAAPDIRETCTTMNICQDDTGGTAVGNISMPETANKKPAAVEAPHKVGDTFPAGDGCNTCTYISDGAMACTLMYCGKGSVTPPADVPEPTYPGISSEATGALTADVAEPIYLGTPSLQFSNEYIEELTSKIAKKTAKAVRDACRAP